MEARSLQMRHVITMQASCGETTDTLSVSSGRLNLGGITHRNVRNSLQEGRYPTGYPEALRAKRRDAALVAVRASNGG